MAFKLTYTGEQVQDFLDQLNDISTGSRATGNNIESISNKVTQFTDSTSSTTKYPSTSAVINYVLSKFTAATFGSVNASNVSVSGTFDTGTINTNKLLIGNKYELSISNGHLVIKLI